jgi:hypothetical protein
MQDECSWLEEEMKSCNMTHKNWQGEVTHTVRDDAVVTIIRRLFVSIKAVINVLDIGVFLVSLFLC